MTYADPALVTARNYLISLGIPGNSIGIVGDKSHRSSGGYHVGNDVLAMIGKLHSDYSKRQTDKDRPGSNAAMALDIGGISGQRLYELTAWIIAQCRAGTHDTRNIREVVGRRSPAGGVTRYDALGILGDSGSIDHETHTHISYYRDSEGGDKTSLFRRYFEGGQAPVQGEIDMDYNQAQKLDAVFNVYDTVRLDTDAVADGAGGLASFPVPLTQMLKAIRAEVTSLAAAVKAGQQAPVNVDAGEVAQALASNPEFLAAIAKAVNDDAHRRSAE